MQALGAYGFRGFLRAQGPFLQSVPYALKNLRWLLHHVTLPIALPTLLGAFHSMLGSEKLHALASDADSLVVRIFSFSFSTAAGHKGMTAGMAGGSSSTAAASPNPGAGKGGSATKSDSREGIGGGHRISEPAGQPRTPVPGQRAFFGDASESELHSGAECK
jgi:hypothetical protein